VHGLSGSSSAWDKYEKYFEHSANIISFDLRGHGKSWKPSSYEAYRIENLSEDLHMLLENLGVKQSILISHSFACFVVFEFLRKYQHQVSRVVFLSPAATIHGVLSAEIVRPFLVLGVSLFRLIPARLKVRGHVDYSQYSDNGGDWNMPITTANIVNTSLRIYLYASQHPYNCEYTDLLSEISVPALVIHGRKDTIFPIRLGLFVAEHIPHSQLIIIEDTNHILVLNNFKEVSKAIQDFIE